MEWYISIVHFTIIVGHSLFHSHQTQDGPFHADVNIEHSCRLVLHDLPAFRARKNLHQVRAIARGRKHGSLELAGVRPWRFADLMDDG